MIGSLGSSSGVALGSIDDLMKLLALVSDPVKAKAAVQELQDLIKDLDGKRTELAVTAANIAKDRQVSEEAMRAVDAAKEANTKRAADLDVRTRAVEAEFAKLATAQTRLKQSNDAFETRSSATATDLTAREDSVARREALQKQAEQDVAAMRADLQVRLDRIRAAAA